MTIQIGFAEYASALNERWLERGVDQLVTGGLWTLNLPDKPIRPYALIPDPNENLLRLTNQAQYDRYDFILEVVANNLDQLGPIIGAIKNAWMEAPIILGDASHLSLIRGRITYTSEKLYASATIEFTALLGQNRIK